MRVSAEECGKIARAMLRWDRRAAKEIAGLILKGPRSGCSASPGPSGEGAAPSSLRAEAEERAIMLVDDTGVVDSKPVNPTATALMKERFGPQYPHSIHGDVVIANDEDFA